MTKNKEKPSFEDALLRLEEIVKMLENGKAPLDESLSMFEEGVALVKLCGKHLDQAEQKIQLLVKNEQGEYHEEPFTNS